jgi:hypothetical protein
VVPDPTAEAPYEAMSGEDVYLRVEDIGQPPPYLGEEGSWQVASLPVRIETANEHLLGGPAAGAVRPLVINGRGVVIFVAFDSYPTAAQIANEVLATLALPPL